MKRWAISKFINIVLLLSHVSESCRSCAIYVMHVRVFFPAHPSVCTGSSCSGEEHSVQTDLWTLQTPPHHTEGDHLSNHLTTSELLLKHTNTHTCTSVKKTNTHTFSCPHNWVLIPISRNMLWRVLTQMQRMRTLQQRPRSCWTAWRTIWSRTKVHTVTTRVYLPGTTCIHSQNHTLSLH